MTMPKLTPLTASSLVASWIDCDRDKIESDYQRDLWRLHDHLLGYLPQQVGEGLTTDAKTAAAFICRARHGRKSQEPTCPSCRAAVVAPASPFGYVILCGDGGPADDELWHREETALKECARISGVSVYTHLKPFSVRPVYLAPQSTTGEDLRI